MDDDSVRVLEGVRIPMSDGTRLAARVWLPDDAESSPVPAVLEYLPYRSSDHKRVRDGMNHGWFAAHGYAGVRVDLRGSGNSDGVLRDEYLQQELDDGLEVLRWIAAQPWCTGDVGLFGLSWAGFNGLQLAALRPPELRAVITVSSSDDRYTDDVHYMGGCLLTDNLSWAANMFGFNSLPPDPAEVGDRWEQMWLERLEGSGLWLREWLDHQHRDDYWRHGSVREDYSAIEVPVMAVSGWSDGYSNTVFRLLEHLDVPRRALVGPWGHRFPHLGEGFTIDFLTECRRWWDQWMKGIDTGVTDEPMLVAWMQDTSNPILPTNPGRWVAEPVWPPTGRPVLDYHIAQRALYEPDHAASRGAVDLTDHDRQVTVQSPLSCGLFAGKWCSYAAETDLPWDQRAEDGGALTFDTRPLDGDLEIFGAPELELVVSSDKPVAMVAVRLCDVAPDDRATRVTFGIANLTHRNGHEHPTELQPGTPYRVRIRMNGIAQRFPAGHRVRLAISSSYWPLAWPSPESPRLTIHTGDCRLLLPERPPQPLDATLGAFAPGEAGPETPTTLLAPAERRWEVKHDLAANEVSLAVTNDDAVVRLNDIDLVTRRLVRERYSYRANRYDTLRAEASHERGLERGDWQVSTQTRTVLTSTRTHFLLRATLDAYEGDVRIYSRSWDESVPRRLV